MRIPLAVVSIALLAGCSAAPPPEPVPTPIAIDATCQQAKDVISLVVNFQVAYHEGRFSGIEFNQSVLTAQRLADMIDVEPGTDLASAIGALRATLTDPSGDEFGARVAAVGDLCAAGGFEQFGISMWTGG